MMAVQPSVSHEIYRQQSLGQPGTNAVVGYELPPFQGAPPPAVGGTMLTQSLGSTFESKQGLTFPTPAIGQQEHNVHEHRHHDHSHGHHHGHHHGHGYDHANGQKHHGLDHNQAHHHHGHHHHARDHDHDHHGHDHDHNPHGHDHAHGHDHHHHHDHGPSLDSGIHLTTSWAGALRSCLATHGELVQWIMILSALNTLLFLASATTSSLVLRAYSFLIAFDVLAMVNVLLSHLVKEGTIAEKTKGQHAFGLSRVPVVFAFTNALSLLFGGTYAMKEAMEHLLEPAAHIDHMAMFSILWPLVFVSIGVLGIVRLEIHKLYYPLVTRSAFHDHLNNPFIQSHLLVGAIQLAVLWIQSMYSTSSTSARAFEHVIPVADALGALVIGVVLMWVSVPVAIALGRILLHVTPPEVQTALGRVCADITALPTVTQVSRAQCWPIGFNQHAGTLHIQLRPSATSTHAQVRDQVKERLATAGINGDWFVQVERGGNVWT